MKKAALLLAAGAAAGFLVLLGAGKASPGAKLPLASLPRGSRLLLIGDSFAQGLKGPLAGLAQSTGAAFEGHSEVSSRIDQWAADPNLVGYLSSFRPTLVLIVLGTNDEAGLPEYAAAIAPKIATLLQKIRASGAQALWVGPPSLPFARKGVSDQVKKTGVRYFPSEILSIARQKDDLHATGDGYAAWANAIWGWLTSGHEYQAV